MRQSETTYKAHLFQSIGNGKLHPGRTQCGKQLNSNHRGTFVVKTGRFKTLHDENADDVCLKCLQWLNENQKKADELSGDKPK